MYSSVKQTRRTELINFSITSAIPLEQLRKITHTLLHYSYIWVHSGLPPFYRWIICTETRSSLRIGFLVNSDPSVPERNQTTILNRPLGKSSRVPTFTESNAIWKDHSKDKRLHPSVFSKDVVKLNDSSSSRTILLLSIIKNHESSMPPRSTSIK